MDFYPLNLIFAIATASATIFLGFLPTRNIRSDFFARQILLAIFAWAFIGLASSPQISHYHFIVGFFCFASFWQFRRDRALSGKMWLSIASGLGISVGVMLILATTPRAYPPALTQPNESLLLASIYLGGSVIGLAYVCHVLTRGLSTTSGVTSVQVQRYVGLLTGLIFVRAGILLFNTLSSSQISGPIAPDESSRIPYLSQFFGHLSTGHFSLQTILLLVFVVLVLPTLALTARRVSQAQASFIFIGICLVGILAETLARLLVL